MAAGSVGAFRFLFQLFQFEFKVSLEQFTDPVHILPGERVKPLLEPVHGHTEKDAALIVLQEGTVIRQDCPVFEDRVQELPYNML